MPEPIVTPIDLGELVLEDDRYRDETLFFAEDDTVRKGTILARRDADDLLIPFVPGGAGGAETPVAILAHDHGRPGEGTERIRVLVRGTVNRFRLILHADGDASNVTPRMLDQLRHVGITALDVAQHAILEGDHS